MDEVIYKKPEDRSELVKTKERFFYWFDNAKNQFFSVSNFLQKNPSLEEAKSFLNQFTFLPFVEYIAEYKVSLSPEILNDEECKAYIIVYDDLVERLKNFDDVKILARALAEFEEFIKK